MSDCSGNAAPAGVVDGGCTDPVAPSDSHKSDLFTLAVVAQMFKLSPLALRWYEFIGLVRRRRAGNRLTFSWTDCERIALIVKAHAAGLKVGDVKAVIRAMGENAPRTVADDGRRQCLALVHALEERQRATGSVLVELYRIDRKIGADLREFDKTV